MTVDEPRHPAEELAEAFLARHRRGENPSIETFAAEHPEHAAEIRDLFPTLLLMEKCGPASGNGAGQGCLESGRTRLGEYRLVREIGRGGMGVVFEAIQESLGRQVALKILPASARDRQQALERFQREAAIAARLHHTNIVPVFGAGLADDHHFFAMQLIDGNSLRDLLGGSALLSATSGSASTTSEQNASRFDPRNVSDHTGPDSFFREVAGIGLQIAEALAYAHSQGVLHRDIKPSNLLRDRQGTIWVTDFGLAKVEDGEDLTSTGDYVGTLRYMAPEGFQGQQDARSDIYSVGLTLYELATHRPAFDADNRADLVRQVTQTEPNRPRTVNPLIPQDLDTILAKSIEREPALRYQTAAELADDLRCFLEDRPIKAKPLSLLARTRRWCRRNPAVATLAATSTVLLLTVAVVILIAYLRTSAALTDEALARAEAQLSQRDALAAKTAETNARRQAERDRDTAQERLYVARMVMAQRAWTSGEVDLSIKIREELQPRPGERDFRGWEWHFLDDQVRRVVETFDLRQPGIPGAVFSAAFSPDGKWLATDNGVKVAQILDVKTRKVHQSLPHLTSLYRLGWSPDGRFLATMTFSMDVIRIWDPATGKLLQMLPTPNGAIRFRSFAWHPESNLLATSLGEETRVWNVETANPLYSLAASGILCWSPDGARLAVTEKTGIIVLWDVKNRKVTARLAGHKETPCTLAWHGDNVRLASASWDGSARVWDAVKQELLITLPHPGRVEDLAWKDGGDRLATVCDDRSLRVWNVRTGELEVALRNHGEMATSVSWHPDGRLVTSSTDRILNLWNLENYQQSLHGTTIALNGTARPRLPGVVLSADGKRGARFDAVGREVQLIDVATGKPLKALNSDPKSSLRPRWSPTGRSLAWIAPGGAIRIWDDERQEERLSLPADVDRPRQMEWSPDGKMLASTDQRRTIKLWDTIGGRLLCEIDGNGLIDRLIWSSRSDYLLAIDVGGLGTIWETARGTPVGKFANCQVGSLLVSWSPDGRLLVLPEEQRSLRIVDTETWKEAFTLRGHTDAITAVAWSPDGRRLASVSLEKAVNKLTVWNMSAGLETWAFSFARMKGQRPRPVWSTDGHKLSLENEQGSVSWDAGPGFDAH